MITPQTDHRTSSGFQNLNQSREIVAIDANEVVNFEYCTIVSAFQGVFYQYCFNVTGNIGFVHSQIEPRTCLSPRQAQAETRCNQTMQMASRW